MREAELAGAARIATEDQDESLEVVMDGVRYWINQEGVFSENGPLLDESYHGLLRALCMFLAREVQYHMAGVYDEIPKG